MACSSSDFIVDDARRVKAAELEELIIEIAAESGPEVALRPCLDLIRLLESDEAKGWGERYQGMYITVLKLKWLISLAGAHFSAYMLNQALNRYDDSLFHARQALYLSSVYEGVGSPQTLRYKEIVEEETNG